MLRRRFRRKNRQKSKDTKVGSFGFLFAIPSVFLLGLFGLIVVISLFEINGFEKKIWTLFGGGAIAAFIFSLSLKLPRLRTLIHEIKHAAVVVLTGNSVKGLEIGKHTGQIDYSMRLDKLHFAPLIGLAPYFFPLLSLPVLIVCLIWQNEYYEELLLLLGVTLATDIATGIYELHPNQTDIKRMIGGFAIAGTFIAGCHLLWTTTCLIWVIGKRDGFVYAWDLLLTFAEKLL